MACAPSATPAIRCTPCPSAPCPARRGCACRRVASRPRTGSRRYSAEGGRHHTRIVHRTAVARVAVPVPVGLHKLACDGAHRAAANGLAIDTRDRQHAAARGGEKHLARTAQLLHRQRTHLQRPAPRPGRPPPPPPPRPPP